MSICQQRWGRKEPFCKGLNMDVNRIDKLTEKHLNRLNRYKQAIGYLRDERN